jgi:hypothetical protein
LPQQPSSGQPHEASQQPLSLQQASAPQQASSPQQPSLQPHEASQHLCLRPNRRLRKQPFLQPQLLEAQPHEASQQLSAPQQASSPQQPSSGQPQEASSPQQPLPAPQQASSPQQPSLQPQLASQQDDFRLNRFKRQQPRLQQLEPPPQQASSPQHASAQGSSQQPHDFSQQHDGSALSQPQPPASIRSSKPAPKLGLARQRLITSAPKTFFIEPRLLFMGANLREDLTRRRGSAAAHPGGSVAATEYAARGAPQR